MSAKGKGLLILAGMAPKGAAPANDDGEEEAPDSERAEPATDVVDAAEEALGAAKEDDREGFARALCKLIDAHEEAKASKG